MTLLVVLYLGFVALVARRLLVTALPRPVDVVALSLFYYNVPLALAAIFPVLDQWSGSLAFLNAVAQDERIAQRTLLAAILGSASLVAGNAIGRRVRLPLLPAAGLRMTSGTQSQSVVLVLVAMVFLALGIVLFGEAFFAGYATGSDANAANEGTALIYFCYEFVGLAVFVWWVCATAFRRASGWVWIVGSIIALIVVTVLRGKRLELVAALLPALLILWETRLRGVASRVSVIAAIALLMVLLASLRIGDAPSLLSIPYYLFAEGLYAGHVTPGIIEAVDQGAVAPEYGARFLVAAVALIPRFVMPGKDAIYEWTTDITQFAPLGASSLLGEVYLQGGLAAVITGFFCLGLLASAVEVRRIVVHTDFRRGPMLSLRALGYVVFVCFFVPHFRDGIVPSAKIALQLGIAMLLVYATRITWRQILRGHATERMLRKPHARGV